MDDAISKLRLDYSQAALLEQDAPINPMDLFKLWFTQAQEAKVLEPNVMTISTVDNAGVPHTRIVLLKGINEQDALLFFTNYNSDKSQHLIANGNASILFPWVDLERQVRMQTKAIKLSHAESENYFKSRPRKSQLGAWASAQSSIVPNRAYLDDNFATLEKKYAGQDIPMPDFWGGWVLQPYSIEFWQGRTSRLHDRLKYTLEGEAWKMERLAP